MKALKKRIAANAVVKTYLGGKRLLNDPVYLEGQEKSWREVAKTPSRTEVINFLLAQFNRKTTYLEIGVRNPHDNYNHIHADVKYGVDPGIEFTENPVDFKMTSDVFFDRLGSDNLLSKEVRFDVIFIDGLHLAEQVDRDVSHSFNYLSQDGFIVLHDCNPPTEWHARENHEYSCTPAGYRWNGTTWKAFLKWRTVDWVKSCCIDSDWGVGILSKKHTIGESLKPVNSFYEFSVLDRNRKEHLNLVSFADFKNGFSK